MKTPVLFLLLATLTCPLARAADRTEEPLTEEMAKGLREMHGIRDLGAVGDADAFAFRDEGKFLVSHQTFSSQLAAEAYCKGKPGYALTQGMMSGAFTLMGLPFVNLREQMVMKTRAIPSSRGGNTGVIAWVRFDLSKIPADHKFSAEEQAMVDLIRSGDFLMAMTDGDGGSGDGFKSVKAINEALKALGKPAVAMAAICVEPQLEKDWR